MQRSLTLPQPHIYSGTGIARSTGAEGRGPVLRSCTPALPSTMLTRWRSQLHS